MPSNKNSELVFQMTPSAAKTSQQDFIEGSNIARTQHCKPVAAAEVDGYIRYKRRWSRMTAMIALCFVFVCIGLPFLDIGMTAGQELLASASALGMAFFFAKFFYVGEDDAIFNTQISLDQTGLILKSESATRKLAWSDLDAVHLWCVDRFGKATSQLTWRTTSAWLAIVDTNGETKEFALRRTHEWLPLQVILLGHTSIYGYPPRPSIPFQGRAWCGISCNFNSLNDQKKTVLFMVPIFIASALSGAGMASYFQSIWVAILPLSICAAAAYCFSRRHKIKLTITGNGLYSSRHGLIRYCDFTAHLIYVPKHGQYSFNYEMIRLVLSDGNTLDFARGSAEFGDLITACRYYTSLIAVNYKEAAGFRPGLDKLFE